MEVAAVDLLGRGVKRCSDTVVHTRSLLKAILSHFMSLPHEAGHLRMSPICSWLKRPLFLRISKVKCNIKFIFQPLTQSRPFPQSVWIMDSFSLLGTPRTSFLLWANLKDFICFLSGEDSLWIKILNLTPKQDVSFHSLDGGGELSLFLKIKKKGRGGVEKA